MTTSFKKEQYDEGITNLYDKLQEILKQINNGTYNDSSVSLDNNTKWAIIIILIIVVLFIAFACSGEDGGSSGGSNSSFFIDSGGGFSGGGCDGGGW